MALYYVKCILFEVYKTYNLRVLCLISKAGIDLDRLDIAFEHETTAKWCIRHDGPYPNLIAPGSQYMIIDQGGKSIHLIKLNQLFRVIVFFFNVLAISKFACMFMLT